jgi:predicted Zn-dependent protease
MGTAGWDIVGATLVTVLTAGPLPVGPLESGAVDRQGGNTTMARIRTADPDITRAIAQATEWSQTFRRLVEAIERTDGVVWVSRGRCGSGAPACLLTNLIVSGPHRLLHIHVAPRRSGDELMASIGHELQHAVEVLGSSARSTAEMFNFFEYTPGVYRIGGRFETREAVEAGFAVGREVTRSRQPRIRTDDPDIARVIAHAREWSGTFRGLVETIERTDGVVWVVRGRCDGAQACLLMYLEVAGPYRLLRIHIDPRQSGARLMESLGHELQHAVEVLGTKVRTATGVYHFFDRNAFRIGGRFETQEALHAGLAVASEVARARGRPGVAQASQP